MSQYFGTCTASYSNLSESLFEENLEGRKKVRKNLFRSKRGMVGIEAAIVLIAFVIVAAAFSFMVINMGLFSTQRGKETIQDALQEASCPLTVDGLILIKGETGSGVSIIVIPLKTIGVKYVPMDVEKTVVTLTIFGSASASYPNIYKGINKNAEINETTDFDSLADNVQSNQAILFIEGSNGDDSLDATEKGYLIIKPQNNPVERDHVIVEIRPQKGAPLSIEFTIPPQLPSDESWLAIGV
ncbi:MAG: archaellin/type IV pilin N-terminal domain-containing protein [Candidatus Bathyarchaeia archaeon]